MRISDWSSDVCASDLTSLLQHSGQGNGIRIKGHLSAFQAVSETTHFIIATDIGMSRVPAGQQHATGRSTDGNAGIMLGKAHPFNSHTVQIWCIDLLLPVTTQLTVPQVIGINVDDIRSDEHTSEL